MHIRLQVPLCLLFFLVASGNTARSAEIVLLPGDDKEARIIVVTGTFNTGDDKIFADTAIKAGRAAVFFNSNGGMLIPAMEIGKAIRLKGFVTAVLDNSQCASACALAWLAGVRRFMGPNARIGFHAASTLQNGQAAVASTGNALAGGYLTQLGLSEAAIVYVTSESPESIRWLTPMDAQRYGIEVSILPPLADANPGSSPTLNPTPESFSPGSKAPAKPSYARNLETDGLEFIQRHLQTESEPLAEAISRADGEYAETVFYYGKPKSKAEVMSEFAAFISRWPVRAYALQPGSGRISCNDVNQTCDFDGIINWNVESFERNKRSSGTSTWSVRIQKGNSIFLVISRNGTVTDRHISNIRESGVKALLPWSQN